MAKPSYRRFTFDLAVPRTRERIVDVGNKYNAISVVAIPVGAVVSLAFSDGADLVPLAPGDAYEVHGEDANGCPVAADEGLYMSNPAGGGLFELLVSFGSIVRSA